DVDTVARGVDGRRGAFLGGADLREAGVELDQLEVLQRRGEGLRGAGVRQERVDAARETDRREVDADLVELDRVDAGRLRSVRVTAAPAATADGRGVELLLDGGGDDGAGVLHVARTGARVGARLGRIRDGAVVGGIARGVRRTADALSRVAGAV